MLGIAIDTLLLIGIVSLLARQNLMSEWFRFFLCVVALIALGFLMAFGEVNPYLALIIYFAALFALLKGVIHMSWLGAVIGGVLFVAAKFALSLLLGLAFA